ncbi:MAG: class I SAM-dependent methyltransferase [Candidatus Delongbacteria bacterium]|nr:class I SAM-dependent methyltransferase [Candidatus Delongbacteria bacterium]
MEKMSFFKNADYDLPDLNEDIFRLIRENSRVLDVGCASGKLAERLKKEKNCFVVGIEFDSALSEKALSKCDKFIRADVSTLKELPFAKDFFDYIVFADVLEHLINPDEVLRRFRDYLADSGFVLLSIPNIAYWQIRLRLLFGNFNYDHPLLDGGHFRFFTLSSSRRLLEECGYKVVFLTNRNTHIKLLGKIWKSLFAFQFIIQVQKDKL